MPAFGIYRTLVISTEQITKSETVVSIVTKTGEKGIARVPACAARSSLTSHTIELEPNRRLSAIAFCWLDIGFKAHYSFINR